MCRPGPAQERLHRNFPPIASLAPNNLLPFRRERAHAGQNRIHCDWITPVCRDFCRPSCRYLLRPSVSARRAPLLVASFTRSDTTPSLLTDGAGRQRQTIRPAALFDTSSRDGSLCGGGRYRIATGGVPPLEASRRGLARRLVGGAVIIALQLRAAPGER